MFNPLAVMKGLQPDSQLPQTTISMGDCEERATEKKKMNRKYMVQNKRRKTTQKFLQNQSQESQVLPPLGQPKGQESFRMSDNWEFRFGVIGGRLKGGFEKMITHDVPLKRAWRPFEGRKSLSENLRERGYFTYNKWVRKIWQKRGIWVQVRYQETKWLM